MTLEFGSDNLIFGAKDASNDNFSSAWPWNSACREITHEESVNLFLNHLRPVAPNGDMPP
jgi:hypothetical protein